MQDLKILVSVFHKPGKHDENFEKLKVTFNCFDIFIPRIDFYGNKWRETKSFFLKNNYDSLFVICSDVSVISGDIISKIKAYGSDEQVGTYGFGTINNFTFSWLKYDEAQTTKSVPFIEGYCFGVNKKLLHYLELDTVYGYGLDVEMGYRSGMHGLKCVLDNEVCIKHEYGKSYSDQEAKKEYHDFLIKNPEVHKYLNDIGIYEPI